MWVIAAIPATIGLVSAIGAGALEYAGIGLAFGAMIGVPVALLQFICLGSPMPAALKAKPTN